MCLLFDQRPLRMKTISTLFLSGALLLSSCKKDNIPDVPPVNEGPTDVTEFNLGDTIEFGLTDNMVIDDDSVVLQVALNGSLTHDIDSDADGTVDFQISMNSSQSLGAGLQVFTRLTPMHANALVRSFERIDTTFLINDTVTMDQINRTYSCSRSSPFDSVVSTTQNAIKISWSNTGDLLTVMDEFHAGEVVFRRTNSSAPVPNYEPPYTVYTTTNRNCFLLPLDQLLYLGLAIRDNNGDERLGWLKLKHKWNSKIVIYESALQEL